MVREFILANAENLTIQQMSSPPRLNPAVVFLLADQMLSLEGYFRRVRKDVVTTSAISKMKNLKCLKLTEEEWGMVREVHAGTFSGIFNNMLLRAVQSFTLSLFF